jgi:hypothetical protein
VLRRHDGNRDAAVLGVLFAARPEAGAGALEGYWGASLRVGAQDGGVCASQHESQERLNSGTHARTRHVLNTPA